MPFTIDTTSYPKAKTYGVGHGYGTRPGACTSGVVHSTNNANANTSFSSEANFLYTSPNVSAHFLVGKDGRIVQFLDVAKYQAWHAGGKQQDGTWTAQAAYANPASFGIELHKSTPDPFYPQIQLDALAWLLQLLSSQFHIAPVMIETHGQIALPGPYDRKTDPDDWPHSEFTAWRDGVFATGAGLYRVRHTSAVFEAPEPDARVALNDTAELHAGDQVDIDEIAHGGWAHLSSGLGFVPSGVLTRV